MAWVWPWKLNVGAGPGPTDQAGHFIVGVQIGLVAALAGSGQIGGGDFVAGVRDGERASESPHRGEPLAGAWSACQVRSGREHEIGHHVGGHHFGADGIQVVDEAVVSGVTG